LFFVRVILFFMSRTAENANAPIVAEQSEAVRASYRSVSHHASTSPAVTPSGEDAVTKDEMMKLFGSALRVR
jgi:hypothetical protein